MGYPKEVYESAWGIINQRRQSGSDNLLLRREDVVAKIPEIGIINDKMALTGTAVIKAIVNNPKDATTLIGELTKESLSLQKKREELLIAGSFPADYLKEQYFCSICNDKGYVGTKMCSCFILLLKQQAAKLLNYLADSDDFTFDRFDLSFYSTHPEADGVVPRERMNQIAEFCKNYARTFSINSSSLLMMGKTGLGKTHLSLAIANNITSRGFGVMYTPVQKLMDKLESQKFSYSQEDKIGYASNMSSVLGCDLLILDDLGTEFITSFTTSVLYNIVNSRLVDKKPTIINTNLEPHELEGIYSQRMASRLSFEYKILRFYGKDVRFLNLKQRHLDKQ